MPIDWDKINLPSRTSKTSVSRLGSAARNPETYASFGRQMFTTLKALPTIGKKTGEFAGKALLEIPKGIGRALLTPFGMTYEAATGKKPGTLPFVGDITAPRFRVEKARDILNPLKYKDYSKVGSRILDVSMVPGASVRLGGKAVLELGSKIPVVKKAAIPISNILSNIPSNLIEMGRNPRLNPNALQRVLEWSGRRISPEAKEARGIITEAQREKLFSDILTRREAKQQLGKLSNQEFNDFYLYATGRATPTNPSEGVLSALDWYSGVVKKQEASFLKRARTPEQAVELQKALDERKYLELRKLTGQSTEELRSTFGIKPDAAIKVSEAIKARKPFEPLYFPIVSEEMPRWGEAYLSKQMRQPWKPGFTKKATGAGIAGKRMTDAYKVTTQRTIKENAEAIQADMVARIEKALARPVARNPITGLPELKPGEVLWRPEGTMRGFPIEGVGGVHLTKKGVKELAVSKAVMEEYSKLMAGRRYQNEWLQFALKGFDAVTNLWKITTLPLRPAWMAINTVGNGILNVVGGVEAKSYLKALAPKYRKLFSQEQLEKLGVRGITGGSAELKTGPMAETARKLYQPNQWIENYFRWVHFIDKAGKAATQQAKTSGLKGKARNDLMMDLLKNSDAIHKKAVGEVNKYLFDYSALSPMEQEVMRRVVPFYTWSKSISRLTGQLAYSDTWKLAQIYKFKQSVEAETKDDENLPSYLRGSIKTGLGVNNQGEIVEMKNDATATPLYWNWKYMFPFYDVMNIGLGALHPALKIPFERRTGQKFYAQEAKEFTAPPRLSKYVKPPEKPGLLGSLVKPTLVYNKTTKELERAAPSSLRHFAGQSPLYNFIENMVTPYAKYTATGQPITSKYGQKKYPKSRPLEILRYGTGVGLYPYKKR